jgi:hypothetical protein
MTRVVRAAILMAIMAGGCFPTATRPELPTWCTTGDCVGVPAIDLRSGTIHATGECIWMTFEDQRVALLWPAHYTATFTPTLTVFDGDGRRVASDGDELTLAILGPDPIERDACGLEKVVQLHFEPSDQGLRRPYRGVVGTGSPFG